MLLGRRHYELERVNPWGRGTKEPLPPKARTRRHHRNIACLHPHCHFVTQIISLVAPLTSPGRILSLRHILDFSQTCISAHNSTRCGSFNNMPWVCKFLANKNCVLLILLLPWSRPWSLEYGAIPAQWVNRLLILMNSSDIIGGPQQRCICLSMMNKARGTPMMGMTAQLDQWRTKFVR